MAKRSLKASETGIKRAKQAFRRTGWTQEYLASAVGLETRQSIWKFFSGRPIERHLFIDICFQLNLEWEEIVAPPDEEEEGIETPPPNDHPASDQAIPTLQSKLRDILQTQCGLLQVSLDTARPLAVEQIYTSTQVFLTPSRQRWLEVANLEAEDGRDEHRHLGQKGTSLAITEVLPTHNKFVILGKPGSGKTTLLQHLTIECVNGNIYPDRLPIFLSLRSFATEARTRGDFSLERHIGEKWAAIGLDSTQVTALLYRGQALILLDGLDEVPRQESNELVCEIQKFAETYPQAGILMTCRLAAQDYQFRGFTYLELADFDYHQIETVARKWFVAISRGQESVIAQTSLTSKENSREVANAEAIGLSKAEQFLQHLERPENEPIREMVTTPLLLHLACLVFYERAMFPTRRAKLYQAGLDILLVRWDTVRGIQRDLGTHQLSLPETLNLLSQIAFTLFEQGKTYFEKSEVLPIITDFLQTLPHAPADPESLWLTGEAVLQTIALQSGLLVERARDIYSFSHLTFQEYLTARKIAARCLKETLPLSELARHTPERRWSEVILLTLSLLPKADPLLQLMQQEVNALVEKHPFLYRVLQWVQRKAEVAPTHYPLVAIKAFYLPLCYNQDMSLAMALDGTFAFDLDPALALDLAIVRTYRQIQQLGEQPAYDRLLDVWFALDFGRQFPAHSHLHHALAQLKARFPELEAPELEWQSWWQQHKATWLNQFYEEILKPQDLAFGWSLSQLEQQTLWEYYKANQFLVDCLNSECSVDRVTRSSIEATLLSDPSGLVSPRCTLPAQAHPGI